VEATAGRESRDVVEGAGLGGLAAAARLARLRHDVVVVEQAPTVGGKLGTWADAGYRFDTGPSLVTLPATIRDLFLKTGKPVESVLELVAVEPLAHYRFADGTVLDVPNADGPVVARAFQEALGGTAGRDWQRFFRYAERLWDVSREPFVESPLPGVRALAGLAARRPADLARVAPWRSLHGVGERFFADPRQRQFLDRYATYTGSDPRRAPAALAVIPYVEQTFRGWWVRGGLRRLVDAVADRARERGARIETGVAVRHVTVDAGRVSGVELADGRHLAADVVVSDADARVLYADLLPSGPATARLARRLARREPSLSGFVLLLGLRGRTPGLRHHTVLFCADYAAEFADVFGPRFRPVDDPTVYLSVPDDPALAPADGEAWFVLVNAPVHDPSGRAGVDWDAPGLADRYADHVLTTLAARGLDVGERVVVRRVRTPADLERETRSPGGAIHGTASHGPAAAFLRPANAGPVPGLFLVGGSAHPGGGIPLVLQSAALVADLVGRA
jgi:phytoene desaturase